MHELPLIPQDRPIRLAVLISGGGTTVRNLADRIAQGSLNAQITAVICSNPKAQKLAQAKLPELQVGLVNRKAYASEAGFDIKGFSDVVFSLIHEARADLVCLAGFLSQLQIPDDYAWRIINIHPALLPAFGGKGMHGRHVHQAVLQSGEKISGCTVHFADQTYDTGPILIQRTCPVLADDTPDTLAKRVFEQECLAYPEAIQAIAQGRVTINGRLATIDTP